MRFEKIHPYIIVIRFQDSKPTVEEVQRFNLLWVPKILVNPHPAASLGISLSNGLVSLVGGNLAMTKDKGRISEQE